MDDESFFNWIASFFYTESIDPNKPIDKISYKPIKFSNGYKIEIDKIFYATGTILWAYFILDYYGKELKRLKTNGELSIETLLKYVQNEFDFQNEKQIAEEKYLKTKQEILINLNTYKSESNSNSYKNRLNYSRPRVDQQSTNPGDLSMVDPDFNKNFDKKIPKITDTTIENSNLVDLWSTSKIPMVDQRLTSGAPRVDQGLTTGIPTKVDQGSTTSIGLSVNDEKVVDLQVIKSRPIVDQESTTSTDLSVINAKLDNKNDSIKFIRELISLKKGQKYKSTNTGIPFALIEDDKVEVYKSKAQFGRKFRNIRITEVGQEFQTENGLLISITTDEIPIIKEKFIHTDEKLEERLNNLINF